MTGPERYIQRVLMTTDAVGGVWNYSLELARRLSAAGIETLLATMGPRPSATQRAAAASIPGITLRESDYILEWMDEPWADVNRAGAWLQESTTEFAPQIVHLNGYAHGAIDFGVPTLVVAHSCVRSWFRAVHGTNAPASFEIYGRRVRAGIAAADAVVAPSQAMAAALRENYNIARDVAVIANGIATAAFFPTATKEPYILSVGRVWDDAKNLAVLASIAGRVPWPIRVAGAVRHPSGEARALPGLELVGPKSGLELAELYGRAAIYAAPALYEPFGLAILEAAAAGAVLVLGDIPSLREIWGNAARYIHPRDVAGWAGALRQLAGDPGARAELSRRARERARLYTADRMASQYMTLYTELVSSGRIRGARREEVRR